MAKKSLANPVLLDSFDDPDEELVNVVIETPKGSRNKYSFDEESKIFTLHKVLPVGMDFPYDFGFIPSTRAEDDDPLDVLVLMDERAFPGCLVRARIIGAILGEESKKKGEKKRNDRLIAVAQISSLYGEITRVEQLEASFMKELEKFFVNYHCLDDTKFRVIRTCEPAEARKLLKQSRKTEKALRHNGK